MTLDEAISHIVHKTGKSGPFVFGSYQCDLCGHVGHRVFPVQAAQHPYAMRIHCRSCGQTEGRFLNLNGDPDDQAA